MLGEGADHVLGLRSAHRVYRPAGCRKIKLLLRDYRFSDDIAFRFTNKSWPEWPLTPDKFAGWLADTPDESSQIGLFMDYETAGEHQWADTGIFEFMENLPDAVAKSSRLEFGAARPQTLVANEAAARALEAAGLAVELLVDETNGATVEADPTLLARALGNLLENAAVHAGGAERLTIRGGPSDAPGSAVLRFEVSDRGPGFSKDDLTRAFEPFRRGPTKSDGAVSLGLGLSLVARIARAHGGRAYAENQPGGGATVVIELPKKG